MHLDEAKKAIITVGEGRGFVVQGKRGRLVITAGHCLPFFPPCHSFSFTEERTYQALLGPLGEQLSVWAECLFADPIGDVAVLGPPGDQQLGDEFDAYETLVDAAATLPIADAPQEGPAWLLLLDGRWCRCTVRHNNGMFWISKAVESHFAKPKQNPLKKSS
jgi:hypothetical protein